MYNFLKSHLDNKKILILGFGKEGQSTFHTLRRVIEPGNITIGDYDPELLSRVPWLNDFTGISLLLGDKYMRTAADFDCIIKSPGIPLRGLETAAAKKLITSQTDLFLTNYRNQVAGITGTKGKSTTSSLLYHVLMHWKTNTVLVGNIGIPPFERISEIDPLTEIVCELSSHQLEISGCSPHLAVFLNLYQEHLDHYSSFRDYQESKFNIARYQNSDDFLIFSADDPVIASLTREYRPLGKRYGISLAGRVEQGIYLEGRKLICTENGETVGRFDATMERQLAGSHNLLNIMAVMQACRILQVPDEAMLRAVGTFRPLAHRMQFAGRFNQVDFYDDSISTIPESAIEAVRALKRVNTLILGGYDRGVDYRGLVDFLAGSKVRNLIFMGEAGKRIAGLAGEAYPNRFKCFVAGDMAEAVSLSFAVTRPGTVCLLSPAAASYDMFRNFEERGSIFQEMLKKSKSGSEPE